MAPQKMSCKNDTKYMYTGKEMSPMGLGYCAEAEMVGKKMMGRDGKDWIVGTKNGVKIWQRAPDAPLVREEPVMKKQEITAISDSDSESDSDNEVKSDEEEDVKTPEPVVEEMKSDDEEVKPDDEEVKPDDEEVKPKKEKKVAVRKAPAESATEFEEGVEKEGAEGVIYVVKTDKNGTKKWVKKPVTKTNNKKVKPENNEVKPENNEVKPEVVAPKKRGRPAKAKPIEEVKPTEEVKPKRKYVRKTKTTEDNVDADEPEKKVRKPRAKTEYNIFIGEKMKEMREQQKGLKTTEYMKMAIAEWKIYKENKKVVMEALNETEVVSA